MKTKVMKNLFYALFIAMLAIGCSKGSEEKQDDGPVGNKEMLHGTWGVTHWVMKENGKVIESGYLDYSDLTLKIYSDGRGVVESKYDGTPESDNMKWSYNPGTRILRIIYDDDEVVGLYVNTLTDTALILTQDYTDEGIKYSEIYTFDRI